LYTPARRIISWVCSKRRVKDWFERVKRGARTVSGPSVRRFHIEEEVLVHTVKAGDLLGLSKIKCKDYFGKVEEPDQKFDWNAPKTSAFGQ
jgi:hypothetical protein